MLLPPPPPPPTESSILCLSDGVSEDERRRIRLDPELLLVEFLGESDCSRVLLDTGGAQYHLELDFEGMVFNTLESVGMYLKNTDSVFLEGSPRLFAIETITL